MKAIVLRELGGPEQFEVGEVDDPRPGNGDVLVKIRRAALNRRDVFITQGLYPGIVLPRILGSDACGEVASTDGAPDTLPIGTRVIINPMIGWGDEERIWRRDSSTLGMPRDGTLAQYIAVPAENVYAAPPHLSDDEAAALPLAGVTAFRACFSRGELRKEDTVLITGVGGGVQTFVLQFVKAVGARAIVTSGSDAKLERAKALGADVCINYKTTEQWSKAVRDASNGGPSLVIDSVGGETLSKAIDVARYGARVVVYGGTTGDSKVRPFSIFWKQLDIRGTSMGSAVDFQKMLDFTSGNSIRPIVDEVFAMHDIVQAARRLAESSQFGKVVVAIDD